MQPFTIPLGSLKAGRNHFDWEADGSFFATFGNDGIQDAGLSMSVDVLYRDDAVRVSCRIEGSVTTTCDRCLETLVIPVDTGFEDEDFEAADLLDLSQDIYDYVCISLPMVRVHPDGECNEETLKYLSK